MKKIILITILLIFLQIDFLSAINMGQIIVYPIPFNPRTGSKLLTLGDKSGGPAGTYSIDIEILDINGDEVFSRNYTTFPVRWNGYNKKGKRVSPGFYILKAEVEDTATGSQDSKIFRILVRY
jgi:hypothetical protein